MTTTKVVAHLSTKQIMAIIVILLFLLVAFNAGKVLAMTTTFGDSWFATQQKPPDFSAMDAKWHRAMHDPCLQVAPGQVAQNTKK